MIGQTISHYKILEELGRGGMGVVYKAEDTKLKRTVAMKFLPKDLSVHGEERERFTLEAQAASALNHPNVATIYEIDEADGETFIVMEYVEGKTLREARHGLTLKHVIDIGVQIAEGLAAAHEKAIVHRDVKAENIMVRKDGRVQVMDFGLAKLRGVSKLTKMGSTIGTISYMSPEQAQGIETDHRTDIFSLGVLLYELLTGQLPFKGGHEAAVMYEIVNVNPAPASATRNDVEPELDRIIMKCLEKDRDERYQSMKDVAVDLKHFKRDSEGRRIARSSPIPGTTPKPLPESEEPQAHLVKGSHRWLIIAAAIALLGGAGVVIWQFMKPSTQISHNMLFKPLQLPFTTIWYPGLSSDGNWIAFPATDANNVSEIYYMHASGGEPKKLTSDSLWKFVVDISPDGSQIVYTCGSSRHPFSFPLQIFTVSTLGGSSKKIADRGNAPRWSPDGTSIAYLTDGQSLWIMNADGSNKRIVLRDSLDGGRVSLAWSPDGKSLAWLRTFIGTKGLWEEIILHDLETGKERQLTNDKKNIDEVYWMPQGEILFSSNREGPSNLWTIPSGGGTPTQITKGPGPDMGIKASRDGKRVLYLQQAVYGAVMTADLSGMNPRQITPDDQSVFDPSFSPDGKRIAFLVNDPDPIKPFTYLYLVDNEGRNRHQLTGSGENIENFEWSLDGRKIAYTIHVNVEVDSAHDIAIIDVADPTQKALIGNGRVIQWLKDQLSVNVLRNQTSWRVPFRGGSSERMYEDSTLVLQSPDGLKVAIYDIRAGHTGLSLKVKDKPAKRLVDGYLDQGPAAITRWFPDSKSVMFTKNGELWSVFVETGKIQRYPWKNTDALSFSDVSSDGKQTVFVKRRMNTKLILIDNFH